MIVRMILEVEVPEDMSPEAAELTCTKVLADFEDVMGSLGFAIYDQSTEIDIS